MDYKNYKVVTIRSQHKCCKCSTLIPCGQKALTINKKYKGRQWMCISCLQKVNAQEVEKFNAVKKVLESKALRDSVAFRDDGAWLAYNDALNEEYDELLELFDDDEEEIKKYEALVLGVLFHK